MIRKINVINYLCQKNYTLSALTIIPFCIHAAVIADAVFLPALAWFPETYLIFIHLPTTYFTYLRQNMISPYSKNLHCK